MELEKFYKQQEGHELKSVSLRTGFSSIRAMIQDWPEFSVYGDALSATVQVNELDHISEMNKHAK